MGRPISIAILADAAQAKRELNSVADTAEKSTGRLRGSIGKALTVGLAAVGAAAVKMGVDSVRAASEAEQAVGGVQAVFGKYANSVLADSKKAAQGLGLSAAAYNELITVSGAMLKNKGIDDFAAKSRDLVSIGADLSAQFGGSAKDAVTALNAAMRGESDPIERYGVSLGEAAVKAELFARNQGALTGAALEQAKTQIRLDLITRQTADAQGAFARESGTLAGQQARLGAEWDNLQATLGKKLLPYLTDGAGAVRKLVDNFDTVAPVLGVIVAGMLAYKAASLAQAAALAIQTAGTAGATGATWSLNAALRANPIGLVITALTLLAAGLVLAYKNSETFRDVVDAALKVVKKGFEALGAAGTWLWNNALQPAFQFIVKGIAAILDLWSSMLSVLGKVPGFGWAKDAADAMGAAADKARELADGIEKIPPRKDIEIHTTYTYSGLRGPGGTGPTRGRDDEFTATTVGVQRIELTGDQMYQLQRGRSVVGDLREWTAGGGRL